MTFGCIIKVAASMPHAYMYGYHLSLLFFMTRGQRKRDGVQAPQGYIINYPANGKDAYHILAYDAVTIHF